MQIFVKQLEFVGPHGVYEEERREGRRFSVDLCVDVDDVVGSTFDELGDTLDYRALATLILEVGLGPSCQLVERLADHIVTTSFLRFARITHVSVTLRKYATGVPGDPEYVGVCLERTRTQHDVMWAKRSMDDNR